MKLKSLMLLVVGLLGMAGRGECADLHLDPPLGEMDFAGLKNNRLEVFFSSSPQSFCQVTHEGRSVKRLVMRPGDSYVRKEPQYRFSEIVVLERLSEESATFKITRVDKGVLFRPAGASAEAQTVTVKFAENFTCWLTEEPGFLELGGKRYRSKAN
jgi:hypothetical protein